MNYNDELLILDKATPIYICGPMTGIPFFNKPRFFLAQMFISAHEQSFKVHNPAAWPDGLEYEDYIRKDIDLLSKSEAMYRLKGWENSAGATLETKIAKLIKIPVIDEIDGELDTFQSHTLKLGNPYDDRT